MHGWVVFFMALLLSFAARADERSELAKQHYEEGMAKYHLEKWDQAIDLFEKGFEAKPVPEFLFNIAQAHRFAGRPERAIHFYRKFLQLAPKSPLRAEIEQNIGKLKVELEKQTSAPKPEPKPLPRPEPKLPPMPLPTPEVKPEPLTAPVAVAPMAIQTAAPRPVHKRPWFGAVIGIAAVVVVGGVVAGAVVATQSPAIKETLPTVRF